jgi:hypothetical protein
MNHRPSRYLDFYRNGRTCEWSKAVAVLPRSKIRGHEAFETVIDRRAFGEGIPEPLAGVVEDECAAFFGGVTAEKPLFLDVANAVGGFAEGFRFVRADEAELELVHEMTG